MLFVLCEVRMVCRFSLDDRISVRAIGINLGRSAVLENLLKMERGTEDLSEAAGDMFLRSGSDKENFLFIARPEKVLMLDRNHINSIPRHNGEEEESFCALWYDGGSRWV